MMTRIMTAARAGGIAAGVTTVAFAVLPVISEASGTGGGSYSPLWYMFCRFWGC